MTEAEKYTNKEHAKDRLQSAMSEYIKAAEEFGYGDSEMTSEIEDVLNELGKQWDVL